MRKLNLTSFSVTIDTPEGPKSLPYEMKRSIENIMEAPVQQLTMQGLLKAARVADKIIKAEGDSVLLEEEEYKLLKDAFEKFDGFTGRDVELCQRVSGCPQVDVKEAQ